MAKGMADARETHAIAAHSAALERPFHFTVVVWGKQFREYFLEYCVPSLLSPNNLPTLSTRSQSKFLIATLAEDWAAMQKTAIFDELAKYVLPTFIEIPPCPPGRSGCEHMGIGHTLITDLNYRERAYAVHLTPDCMLSDGTVRRLQELAVGGTEVVLTAALRFGEEPFLEGLKSAGAIPQENRSDSGSALTISGRQMVRAAVNGFHSQTLAYEWDRSQIISVQPAAWWRVPGEDGVLIHCLSWSPLLLDYAAVSDHDTSTFEQWTLDGDYVYKNAGQSGAIHVSQDSDEMFIASWAPMADRPIHLKPDRRILAHGVWRAFKVQAFRYAFTSGLFDPLKLKHFFLPVRWHASDLHAGWEAVERHARDVLLSKIGTADSVSRPKYGPIYCFIQSLLLMSEFWASRRAIGSRLGGALRGDSDSIKRIWRRVKIVIAQLRPPRTAS
jgi:hypothetical protein